MYEYHGTQQLTGLARSIDRLFRFREPRAMEVPAPEAAGHQALDAAPAERSGAAEAVEAAGAVAAGAAALAGAAATLEGDREPDDAPEVSGEDMSAEPVPPPLPVEDVLAEPVPPPLPVEDVLADPVPPPLPVDDASAEPVPPPLPVEPEPGQGAVLELDAPDEFDAPDEDDAGDIGLSAFEEAEDGAVPFEAVSAEVVTAEPVTAEPEADDQSDDEDEPTELDLAVDAYLDGARDRATEIERLAAEYIEARDVGPVARSVGRLAFGAGEPPESAVLSLAESVSSPVVLGRLARQMGGERHVEKRQEYFQACRVLGTDMARAIRDDLAENTDTLARSVHCEALTQMGPAGRQVVEEMVDDEIWFLARNGVAILGDLGGDGAVELVTGALANPDPRVRREALRSLAKLGAPNADELVVALLDDSDDSVRMAATVAAGELGVGRAVRPLVQMLEQTKDPDRAIPLLRALGQLEDPGAVPAIEKHAVPSLFSKPRTDVRVAAYRALYHIGTPHAMKLLARASSDKDPAVQSAVLGLRKKVGRED